MSFERWWYYGPSPFGQDCHQSRVCLRVERTREVGAALLVTPTEERGWTQTWVEGQDGYRSVKNTLLFELTVHILLWRLTLFCIRARED